MKEYLSAEGVPFRDRNVAEPAAAEELIANYGRMATPTIVIGDRVFLGFEKNRQEIEKLVKDMRGSRG